MAGVIVGTILAPPAVHWEARRVQTGDPGCLETSLHTNLLQFCWAKEADGSKALQGFTEMVCRLHGICLHKLRWL